MPWILPGSEIILNQIFFIFKKYFVIKLLIFCIQTQPCNWREHASTTVKRKKRSVGNITAVDDDDLEESYDYYDTVDDTAAANNKSFSESLKLFQSIQVLANEEERAALSDPSAADSKISLSEAVVFKHCYFRSSVGD